MSYICKTPHDYRTVINNLFAIYKDNYTNLPSLRRSVFELRIQLVDKCKYLAAEIYLKENKTIIADCISVEIFKDKLDEWLDIIKLIDDGLEGVQS